MLAEILLDPQPQGLFILGRAYLVDKRIVDGPHFSRGPAPVFVIKVVRDLGDNGFQHREGRSEYDAGLARHGFRQRPLLGQVSARGGFLIVMYKRQPGILERQYSRGHGHLESGIQRLGYGVGYAEFLFYVELSRAGRELYGLIGGIYPCDAVVAGRGFYDANYVLVYLFFAPVLWDGFYHVLPGQDLVEVIFPEELVPGARSAAGYA